MTIRYFFMAPLLERLAQPAFLARLVAIILRIAAALIALLSLTIFFKVGKLTSFVRVTLKRSSQTTPMQYR